MNSTACAGLRDDGESRVSPRRFPRAEPMAGDPLRPNGEASAPDREMSRFCSASLNAYRGRSRSTKYWRRWSG